MLVAVLAVLAREHAVGDDVRMAFRQVKRLLRRQQHEDLDGLLNISIQMLVAWVGLSPLAWLHVPVLLGQRVVRAENVPPRPEANGGHVSHPLLGVHDGEGIVPQHPRLGPLRALELSVPLGHQKVDVLPDVRDSTLLYPALLGRVALLARLAVALSLRAARWVSS